MSLHGAQEGSLRLARPETWRLAWAFGISVYLHLVCFTGYHAFKHSGIFEALRQTALSARIAEKQQAEQMREVPPLMFVDVNPEIAAAESPKNPKFYSNRNSEAANPESDKDTDAPKIDGQQTDVVKAEDVPRNTYDKLQPTFPREEPKAQPPGDLAMAKPETTLRPEATMRPEPAKPPEKPRLVKEAMARQPQIAGERMKQDAGVRRRRLDPGFDVKATPFGDYDAAFIEAVQTHWYNLLDRNFFNGERHGKVVLRFRLNYDGRVSDMEVLEENVGTVLSVICQNAVTEPAPYGPWSREMRLLANRDFREFRFTFYY